MNLKRKNDMLNGGIKLYVARFTSFSVLITLPRSCSSKPFIVTVKSIMAVRALT